MTQLSDLVTRVRERTNTETDQIVSDNELAAYLNVSLGTLDSYLVNTYQDYKMTTYQATIASNATNSFALPADFYKARGLDRQVNGVWMTLQTYQQTKRNMYSFPIVNYVYGYLDVFYRIRDQVVEIIPAQNCAATYQLWYVPKYKTLALTDTLPVYMDTQDWLEYAVFDVSADVMIKQQLESAQFEQKREMLRQSIIASANPRDAGPAKKVQNTRFSQDWMGPGYDWNF